MGYKVLYLFKPGICCLQFTFTKELEDQHIKEKENGIFECEVTHKKIPVDWFIDGNPVVPGPKYQVGVEQVNGRPSALS